MNTEFAYIKKGSVPEYEYVMAPKKVLHSNLSAPGKVLYISMLERLSLSLQNNWADEAGSVYIIFTLTDAMEAIGCSRAKALRTLAELDNAFIKRKHQGQGKPDLIYLADIFEKKDKGESANTMPEEVNEESDITDAVFEDEAVYNTYPKEYKINTPSGIKNEPLEVSETDSNNNKYKYNKKNNNNHIISLSKDNSQMQLIEDMNDYKECIKLIIDYDVLIESMEKSIVDEIVNVMTSAVCSRSKYIRIGGIDIPAEDVKKRFLSLDMCHIEYVYECLCQCRSQVRNIKSYLLTSIYRAPDTIDLYYKLKVKHDLAVTHNMMA